MARTQAAEYDERKDRIVTTAAELYARTGFNGTSIADLAAACGISKSLLYHYFSSKEDILFAIMAGHVEALDEVARAVAAVPDPERRLRLLTRAFVELYKGASAHHKVLVNDLDKLPEPRRREIVAAERRLVDIVASAVAELSPELRADAPRRRAAAMLYFGMINWTHTWYHPEGALDTAAFADFAATTFLDGIDRAHA